MSDSIGRRRVPPQGGAPPLDRAEAEQLQRAVPHWDLDPAGKAIARAFTFKDFRDAMGFVNAVADLAEEADHHPDIAISYRRVALTLTTHAIGGLSEKDFTLAARIDRLHGGWPQTGAAGGGATAG